MMRPVSHAYLHDHSLPRMMWSVCTRSLTVLALLVACRNSPTGERSTVAVPDQPARREPTQRRGDAANGPSQLDADLAGLTPLLEASDDRLCAIRIVHFTDSAVPASTRVHLAYGRDVRIARREVWGWSVDDVHPKRSMRQQYTWREGRIATIGIDKRWQTTFRYDREGRLVDTTDRYGIRRMLRWKLGRISKFVRAAMPFALEESSGLPWQIGFTGEVSVTLGTGRDRETATYRYGAVGFLELPEQERDANGWIVGDDDETWGWRDGQLVEQRSEDSEVRTFKYDTDRRLIASETRRDGVMVQDERVVYSCPGEWLDDPIWPSPRE